MILISKKRITFVIACIFVAIVTFITKEETETIQTLSLPTSNKTIVIDARSWLTR